MGTDLYLTSAMNHTHTLYQPTAHLAMQAFSLTQKDSQDQKEDPMTLQSLPSLLDTEGKETFTDAPAKGRERSFDTSTVFAHDALSAYLRDMSRLSLLTHKEEGDLARQSMEGDQSARHRLVECNLRLVVSIARRYSRSGVPLVDLIQAGNLGLIHAAEKFDAQHGHRFSTYATNWIIQAMSRTVDEYTHLIHIPEYVVLRMRKVRRLADHLFQENGLDPHPEHIAEAGHLDVGEVIDLLSTIEQPMSLDRTLDESDPYSLADTLQETSPSSSQHLLDEKLQHAFERLTVRERTVLTLHYGIGDGHCRTFTEVGKALGVSRERARQLEVVALRKLREWL